LATVELTCLDVGHQYDVSIVVDHNALACAFLYRYHDYISICLTFQLCSYINASTSTCGLPEINDLRQIFRSQNMPRDN
jgi:hypothetical protein